MKAGWEIKTLKELVTILGDGLHGTPKYTDDGDYYFINGNNLTDGVIDLKENTKRVSVDEFNKHKKNLTDRTILVSINGTLGNVAFYNGEKVILGKSACYFNLKEGVDKNFVKCVFSSPYFLEYAHKEATGATIKNVSLKTMREFQIPLPPLPEQKRLVTLLDEAFESIATAKANAQQNLKNARALFESHLNEVFTKRGEGWEEKTLGEVCILKSGTTVNASLEKTSGDLPYLKVADMNYEGNEIEIVSSSRFLNKSDIGRNAIIPSGTTIFPKRGGAILTNKKRLTIVPICADLNIMGVIPSDALLPKYLYFYFINVDMRQLGSGSSIPQINNYDIEPLTISFPESKSQQEKIICELENLSEETKRLEALYSRKIAALDELKKALLHRAFSGEL